MLNQLPDFQNSISWGAVLQILITMGSLYAGFYGLKGTIGVIRNDISHLQESQRTMTEAFQQLGKILTQVAVQDTRISMIEKKIDELAHGEGLVGHKN